MANEIKDVNGLAVASIKDFNGLAGASIKSINGLLFVQSAWSATYGYFAGGSSSAYAATTDRIVFSTGVTSASTASDLSAAKSALSGVSDGAAYGYFAGGFTSTWLATTDRIVFSTSVTSANTVSNLSAVKAQLAGISDCSAYGYFSAGSTASTNISNTTDRIVFSTGVTSANTVSNLSSVRKNLVGLSDCVSYGYFAGGQTKISLATYVKTTERIVFSTGVSSANTVSDLSVIRHQHSGISDGSTYGYFAGGLTDSSNRVATTDRIVFSTGVTSANTVSNLSVAKNSHCGLSDGATYGYFAGGNTTATIKVATADRIVFSTGVTSANTVSNLSSARSAAGTVSEAKV